VSAGTYGPYLRDSIAGYALGNVVSGRWPPEGALERSRLEHESLLPQGLATPDHYLFDIKDTDGVATVGSIWFAVIERSGSRLAYVYDLEVSPAHRRQGHATRAFEAIEPLVRALSLSSIGLHVFGQNAAAQALYKRLGYGVTGLNMVKHLGDDTRLPHGQDTSSDDVRPFDGGCTCGAVRYRMTTAPLFVHCCHCRWCQRETGASFALNAMIEAERVSLLQGEVEVVNTPSNSGLGQTIARCPTCRIAVWSNYAGAGGAVRFVRVGTLDEPDRLPPDIHIFTASKQPWVVLAPDTPAVAEYYDRNAHWPKASLDRRLALLAKKRPA
jgi:RimJ/RimL family protein N-acetyltransferase